MAFTVFTKPWHLPLPELGRLVAGMGFEGVELPVRPGYPVEPAEVERALPAAARILSACGLRLGSVAGRADARTAAACAEAGVPLIRICVCVPPDRSYLEHEAAVRRELEALVPCLLDAGVAVGVQNHCERCVGSAAGVRRLVEGCDPRAVGAVWDPAHCALAGEPPALAADILWSHLLLVNLKNARWRVHQPQGGASRWRPEWVAGPEGLCDWAEVASELRRRGYGGDVCLTAEYSDASAVERLAAADLRFARGLFGGGE